MLKPRLALHAIVFACLLITACGSDSSPTAPSMSTAPGPAAVAVDGTPPDTFGFHAPGASLATMSVGFDSGFAVQSVAFPPRNEPFAFRQQLETVYRDQLRRGTISTFVDIEGAIVWTQEYLRYRLSGCSHGQSVQYVQAIIAGGASAPDCGGNVAFPPRNEPFDFRANALESTYRDVLRRQPTQTFVDLEGDIVWTTEYLRYRVGNCTHAVAVQLVLSQISGSAPTAGCAPPAPPYTRSGTGNTVFDLPTSIRRVRIIGIFTGGSSNFIVRIAGRLVVNEIIGTRYASTTSDGIYLTTGGVVEVTNSSGVSWSFTDAG